MATGAAELYRATCIAGACEAELSGRLHRVRLEPAVRAPTRRWARSTTSRRSEPPRSAAPSAIRLPGAPRRRTSLAGSSSRTAISRSTSRARTPSACPATSPSARRPRTAPRERSPRSPRAGRAETRAAARRRPAPATTSSAATRSARASSSATARTRPSTRTTGPRSSATACPRAPSSAAPVPRKEVAEQGFKPKGSLNKGPIVYEDSVENYVTSEPAIDYSASSVMLLAALAAHC